MWQQLLSVEILCADWTTEWRKLLHNMFKTWLMQVSHGDPPSSWLRDGCSSPTSGFAAVTVSVVELQSGW